MGRAAPALDRAAAASSALVRRLRSRPVTHVRTCRPWAVRLQRWQRGAAAEWAAARSAQHGATAGRRVATVAQAPSAPA
jgi:hypothetical protein